MNKNEKDFNYVNVLFILYIKNNRKCDDAFDSLVGLALTA